MMAPLSGPDAMSGDSTVSPLFARLRDGDPAALEEVVKALYRELHRMAAAHMRREGRDHTLQATALINEAYLRLRQGPNQIHDRMHFLALAATMMRRALVDHARQKRATKRGGQLARVTLDDVMQGGREAPLVDVLAVDQALSELAAVNERASRVIELRFFGGHTDEEAAEILGVSLPTVRRAWTTGRQWLRDRLQTPPNSRR